MRQALESRFTSFDGQSLFYRHWPAITTPAQRAILRLHCGHEHSGRLQQW